MYSLVSIEKYIYSKNLVLLDLNEVIHTESQWKPYFKPLFSTEKYKQYTATTQENSFLFKNVANTLSEADSS